MHQDVPLITTAAMAFVLAFAFGFAAVRLRLPPLVGYLLAGILMGPFSPGIPGDIALAGQLAEMGVILLMFGVGLHFSRDDLLAVRWIAVPGALGRIAAVTAIGIGLAMIWGWSLGAGLVLGLCLSVASTVVLLRTLEDRNLLATADGRIAVGWLIVEDLAMVLALVLLPALAPSLGGHANPAIEAGSLPLTIAITLGKMVTFVVLAMLVGPRLVPMLLTQVARTGSRELFTLSVLAVALGIAYGSAELFGVSFALGAFFAGVVLSESRFSHRAAAESLPLQDAFAILFFVSVGMLFDPGILLREPLSVLAVLLVVILGKTVIAFLLVLASGFPASTALMVSAGLAQIGEFSFILAGLGVGLGLLPAEGRDLILAASLLSIMASPLVLVAAERLLALGQARVLGVAPWLLEHGRVRLMLLSTRLDELRRRQEVREAEHSLQLQNLIDRFPIFADLDRQAREDLLLLFHPRSAAPGERVIRQGERAEAAYFISSGAVEVRVAGQEIRLGPGEFFGEMALLSGRRRAADVAAIDYCHFLTLERRDFRSFISRHPGLRTRLLELARQRSEMNRRTLAAGEASAGRSL